MQDIVGLRIVGQLHWDQQDWLSEDVQTRFAGNTIPQVDLIERVGTLDPDQLRKLDAALRYSLDL